MRAAEVDVQVLSATPQTYLYEQEVSLAAACAALQTTRSPSWRRPIRTGSSGSRRCPCRRRSGRGRVRRAVRSLGLRGAMIGSNVRHEPRSSLARTLVAAAAELDAFMLVHPVNVAGAERLRSYYLNNLIGNPLDTTIAAAASCFGGVLERHPRLKVGLVHGGGFVPYQAGRWAHGWKVRPEPKVNLKQSPEPWIDRFYYDTILHSTERLAFLVESAGAARVLLGSDYPYDMGTGRMRPAGAGAGDLG